MTVKFSNLQINALRLFMENGNRGWMTLEDFCQIDQRVTSGLGKRKIPFLRKSVGNTFMVTQEGLDAWKMFESTNVFRRVQNTSIAKCFSTSRALRRAGGARAGGA
jgi:hypothetical protein